MKIAEGVFVVATVSSIFAGVPMVDAQIHIDDAVAQEEEDVITLIYAHRVNISPFDLDGDISEFSGVSLYVFSGGRLRHLDKQSLSGFDILSPGMNLDPRVNSIVYHVESNAYDPVLPGFFNCFTPDFRYPRFIQKTTPLSLLRSTTFVNEQITYATEAAWIWPENTDPNFSCSGRFGRDPDQVSGSALSNGFQWPPEEDVSVPLVIEVEPGVAIAMASKFGPQDAHATFRVYKIENGVTTLLASTVVEDRATANNFGSQVYYDPRTNAVYATWASSNVIQKYELDTGSHTAFVFKDIGTDYFRFSFCRGVMYAVTATWGGSGIRHTNVLHVIDPQTLNVLETHTLPKENFYTTATGVAAAESGRYIIIGGGGGNIAPSDPAEQAPSIVIYKKSSEGGYEQAESILPATLQPDHPANSDASNNYVRAMSRVELVRR